MNQTYSFSATAPTTYASIPAVPFEESPKPSAFCAADSLLHSFTHSMSRMLLCPPLFFSSLSKRVLTHLKSLWDDDSGIGTIELVLILVVLIALVAIFKDNIQKLLKDIFNEINSAAADIY